MKDKKENGNAGDLGEELESFAPHILSTPFPNVFKILHKDDTPDSSIHLSTFNAVMKASNVSIELRCMLLPTTFSGSDKSWFDKFKRHLTTLQDQLSIEFKK